MAILFYDVASRHPMICTVVIQLEFLLRINSKSLAEKSAVLSDLKVLLPRLTVLKTLVLEYDEHYNATMEDWSRLADLMPPSLKSLVLTAPDKLYPYVSLYSYHENSIINIVNRLFCRE